MKEILAGNLEKAIEELKIRANKTFDSKTHYGGSLQVWELEDAEFTYLCNIDERDWKDEFGWFRSAEGSNMGKANRRYNINGHYIKAWDGADREELESKTLSPDDRIFRERKYDNLLQYFSVEIGASQPKNVCALATDLARQSGVKMSELFKKYQGIDKGEI